MSQGTRYHAVVSQVLLQYVRCFSFRISIYSHFVVLVRALGYSWPVHMKRDGAHTCVFSFFFGWNDYAAHAMGHMLVVCAIFL